MWLSPSLLALLLLRFDRFLALSEVSVACVIKPGARFSHLDANAMPVEALAGQNL